MATHTAHSALNYVAAAGTGRRDLSPGYQLIPFEVDLGRDDLNDGNGLPEGEYLLLGSLQAGTRVLDVNITALDALTNGDDLDVGMVGVDSDGLVDDGVTGFDEDQIIDGFDGTTAGNFLPTSATDTAGHATPFVTVATAPVVAIHQNGSGDNVTGKFRIGLVVSTPLG